jgi:Superfamily I DNA and RNA helicases
MPSPRQRTGVKFRDRPEENGKPSLRPGSPIAQGSTLPAASSDVGSAGQDARGPATGTGFTPDPEQAAVIGAGWDERLLVVAGPGAGKTQVAAMRLVHLLRQGLQPAQILVLSFSRSAVATLTRRIEGLQLVDAALVEDLRHLAIRTFDSWAFRLLRQNGAPASDLLRNSHDENISLATAALADETQTAVLDRLSIIRHVVVDEFQDLPGVRAGMVNTLLSRLSDTQRKIGFTVLGDPAQSIYGFAARSSGQLTNLDPWQELQTRMGSSLRQVELSTNHRATKKLADMAAGLRRILERRNLEPAKKLAGMRRFLDNLPTSPADSRLGPAWLTRLPEGSLAVLTRTNGEAARVAKMLLGDGIESPPVQVHLRLAGNVPYAPPWIALLLSRFKPRTITRGTFNAVHARAVQEAGDGVQSIPVPPADLAWRRLSLASGSSDGASALDMHVLRERLAWPDSFPEDQDHDEAKVVVTTIHQAKGMEFDNVALLEGKDEGETCDDPLEEARVGFVAVTRAATQLGRLPSTCIYRAPYQWQASSSRTRHVSWGGMVNFQIGLPGDIDPVSLVDTAVHGDAAAVEMLQRNLASNAAAWRGHKVVLRKVSGPDASAKARDVRYDIRLQTGDGSEPLLGRTSAQVTMDLLRLLWDKYHYLPGVIYNLRISEIITLGVTEDVVDSVPEPWRSSGLWLGISLLGTGDFKMGKSRGS